MNSIETTTAPRTSGGGTGAPFFGAASVLAIAGATTTVRTAGAGFTAGAFDRERAAGTGPGSPPT